MNHKTVTNSKYPNGWQIILFTTNNSVITDFGETIIWVKQKLTDQFKFIISSEIIKYCKENNIQIIDNQFIKEIKDSKSINDEITKMGKDIAYIAQNLMRLNVGR